MAKNPHRKRRRRPRAEPPPRTRFKELVFSVAAVLLPFVGLGVAELVCRHFGYGGYSPVIVDVGDDGSRHWYSTHRPGTDTFFDTRLSLTGGMREVHFTTPKPPNTVRIAILGGSAAQGFPQPLPLTNGSFLAAMLREAWGGARGVEVLNFGATAVASFPVLHFLEAVLDHEPDLVVVMSGNNEFYGAYGVQSLHSAGRSPAAMSATRWLRGSGLVQWLTSLRPRRPLPPGKLMEQVAVERRIGPDDSARRGARRSLRAHLGKMVRRCRERGVPVILCTIPTNERMAPIGVEEESAEDRSARLHHARADSLFRLDRHEEARAAYLQARDLDPMPWRATSTARAVVLDAANEGAVLCDMEAEFRSAAEDHVIGWDMMDDHVHLTIRGQALFATAILRSMESLTGPLRVEEHQIEQLPDWRVFADRLGQSVYTDYVAASRIKALFEIPFLRVNNRAAAERAEKVCLQLGESMSEIDRRAVARWRDPGLHGATDRPLSFVVGVYRMEEGDFATAERLFFSARASVPTVSLWRLQLVWQILRCRRQLQEQPSAEDVALCGEAIELGELLLRFGHADSPEVLRYLGLAYNLSGDHASAVRSLERGVGADYSIEGWEAIVALADSYVLIGRAADAVNLLNRASRNPDLTVAAGELLRSLEGSH
jgi:tetratricopeptide (TPR) repeat protein